MKTKDRQIRVSMVLIVLNLCFIWGNSLLPAQMSQAFSDGIKSLLGNWLPAGNGGISGGALIRKIAHFTEFTMLGILLGNLFRLLQKRQIFSLGCGVAAACIDESIQFLAPGRSPGLIDVGIDVCGIITGMFFLQTGYFLLKKNQRKNGGK